MYSFNISRASFHFCYSVTIFPICYPVSGLSSISLRCSVFLFTSPCVALCVAVLRILIFRANTALRVVTGCVTFVLPIPSGKETLRSRLNKHQNIDVHDEQNYRFGRLNLYEEEETHHMREREPRLERFTGCPLPSHLGLKDACGKHPHEKN